MVNKKKEDKILLTKSFQKAREYETKNPSLTYFPITDGESQEEVAYVKFETIATFITLEQKEKEEAEMKKRLKVT